MGAPLQIGRYVLHDEIASGGMASVHYGRLVGTGGFAKTVAIKRLHRDLARAESFRNMILEEGRLAARVRHPNVVPPLDVLAEKGELLLVMEYVHGEALSRLMKAALAAGEKVPLAVGAAIIANVLHGLHAAHEAKGESGQPLDIVHRDISPQNVIVGADGIARVIDFGIAKAVTSDENTIAGTIKGKVPYLAPEQLEGDRATRRTDIYAAGVVFWEVLAGKRLFEGPDDGEVLRNIMSMEVPPPSSLNGAVPGTVDDVVQKAIARNPADRYATAREMALALESAVHLATSTVVGAWAERLAADTLAARAAKIAEVERAPAPSDSIDEIDLDATTGKKGTIRLPSQAPQPPQGAPKIRKSTAPPPLGPRQTPQKGRTSAPPPPLPPTRTEKPPPPEAAMPLARTENAPAPPSGRPSAVPSRPPPPSKKPTAAASAPVAAKEEPLVIPPPPPAATLPLPRSAPADEGAAAKKTAKGQRRSIPDPGRALAAGPHVVPRSAAPQMQIEPRTVIYDPPPLPEPDFVEGVKPVRMDAPAPHAPSSSHLPHASPAMHGPSMMQGSLPPLGPSASVVPQPPAMRASLAPSMLAKPKPARGSRIKAFFGWLAAFLVLGLVVAYMFAPAIMRALLVTSAADRGITLTIERVDVSRKVIHLVDVKAESLEMPGVSLRVGTFDIGLRWLLPATVTLDDAELTLDGTFTDLGARVDKWRASHATQINESLTGITLVEVTSGRIVWNGLVGIGTSALVENVTLNVVKAGQRPLGDDYHLFAPLFAMKLGASPAGPWQIDLERQGVLSRSIVKLDPSGMFPATVTRTASADGAVSVTLAIPPTRLGDLRIPAVVLGGYATDKTRLEAHGQLDIGARTTSGLPSGPAPGGPPPGLGSGSASGSSAPLAAPPAATMAPPQVVRDVKGRIVLAAGSLAVFPSASPVDVSLDLPIAGDPAQPLPITAVLALAPSDPTGGASTAVANASLTGTIDFNGVTKLDLSGKTGTMACVKPATAGGAPASKDLVTTLKTALAITFDDLPGSKLSFTPSATCAPRLTPATTK